MYIHYIIRLGKWLWIGLHLFIDSSHMIPGQQGLELLFLEVVHYHSKEVTDSARENVKGK